MIRVLVLTLLASCAGPKQIIHECTDEPIAGQYEEIGNLRDAVIAFAGDDPSGDVTVYWCPNTDGKGLPEWPGLGGLYLGCNELYAVVDDGRALRFLRHEVSHCYSKRLYGDADPLHRNKEFWRAVE